MFRQTFIYEGLCLFAIAFFSWRLYVMWMPIRTEIQTISGKSSEQIQKREGTMGAKFGWI